MHSQEGMAAALLELQSGVGLGEAPGTGENGGGAVCGFRVRAWGHRGKMSPVRCRHRGKKDKTKRVDLILKHENPTIQTQEFYTSLAS